MSRRLALAAAAAAAALTTPAVAQMDHSMPAMSMPAAPKESAPQRAPAQASKPAADPHADHDMSSMPDMQPPAPTPSGGHDMSTTPATGAAGSGAGQSGTSRDMSQMPGMQMPPGSSGMPAGHDMQGMTGMPPDGQGGTNLPAGNAPPPPVPTDHAADRVYAPAKMTEARHHFQTMHGGEDFYQVMLNIADYQLRDGRDGFRWDGEAWYGGDINRLWLKTEGEGAFGQGVDEAEIQALYSRAIGPYWNLQAGARYDITPNPSRAYATLGIEGLAPYWFEVEAFLYVSDKGDVLAELEASYDQRITQRLILQPRLDVEVAAQDVAENGIGAGVSTARLGARLRYDIRREFSPYIGVEYERAFGDTADFRRAAGEDVRGWNVLIGLRTWF